jgi:hypothetical protein
MRIPDTEDGEARKEFGFFRDWMRHNPHLHHVRAGADITAPDDFKYTIDRDIVPVYARFLSQIGPLDLFVKEEKRESVESTYRFLTPAEIVKEFADSFLQWNGPPHDTGLGSYMPFCKNITSGHSHCFDVDFPGEDDFPVVDLLPPDMEDSDDIVRIAASFRYWLERIVKYGDPLA